MKLWLLICLIVVNTACSTTQSVSKHDFGHYEIINSSPNQITVSTPDWLWHDCIHYRLMYAAPTELRCYNLDQWLAPPADLLKQFFSQQLITQQPLKIELTEFEQQFDSPHSARVLMSMRVNVYEDKQEKIIASKAFQFTKNTASADAIGAVAGFADLTRQATKTIRQWLLRFNH